MSSPGLGVYLDIVYRRHNGFFAFKKCYWLSSGAGRVCSWKTMVLRQLWWVTHCPSRISILPNPHPPFVCIAFSLAVTGGMNAHCLQGMCMQAEMRLRAVLFSHCHLCGAITVLGCCSGWRNHQREAPWGGATNSMLNSHPQAFVYTTERSLTVHCTLLYRKGILH